MPQQQVSTEYSNRINKTVNFILKNLRAPLPLSKLSSIANYSPFHFQKVFKQVMGESPKQYIVRMRLENAAHSLIIHRHKLITEIALESSFASASTFARAFKNYFGMSAEELRNISPKDKIPVNHFANLHKHSAATIFLKAPYNVGYWKEVLQVKVTRVSALNLIAVNAPLSNVAQITESYKKVIQIAQVHDLLTSNTKYIGIISPHLGVYRASLTINAQHDLNDEINSLQIEAGKFAVLTIKGDILQTFHALHAFYELWLPASGYRISNPVCFEMLTPNIVNTAYQEIEREMFISIEPA